MRLDKELKPLLLGGLFAVGLSLSAQAAPTELTIGYYSDIANSMTVVAQGHSHGTLATALKATYNGVGDAPPATHSNPFVTFCLDINNNLNSGPGYWQQGGFGDVPLNNQSPPATRQANSLYRAANLYADFGAGILNGAGVFVDKIKGAALQLAIWEVLYETSGTYNVNSGAGFLVAAGSQTAANLAIRTLANQMLATASSQIDFNLTTTFWNAVNANGTYRSSQDLIGPFSPVPEPSTYIAGALLLIPVLVQVRRWKRNSNA